MKSKKQAKIFIFILAVLLLITFILLSKGNSSENELISDEPLKFSNTQEWAPELYSMISNEPVLLENALEKIQIPPPPENDSDETLEELSILHSMVEERTEEKVAQIVEEVELMTVHIGEHEYSYIIDANARPYTKYLFERTLEEYNPIIMYFKNSFDRVRPSYLDPSLSTAIEIPLHPAYPSGHSSQSHLFAHIMSDIDPENRDVYFESAKEIARNREVAGVHYKSDSEAGRMLAEQFYSLLKETVWYKTIVENAKSEWKN